MRSLCQLGRCAIISVAYNTNRAAWKDAMPTIAIVTDTDAGLPQDVAARHSIQQVPTNVHFGGETFRTGIDIDDHELFARVNREGMLPTTSGPAPGRFVEAFEAAFRAGADAVVCLCVGGEVSATHGAVVVAVAS